jgi:hypothetical protein
MFKDSSNVVVICIKHKEIKVKGITSWLLLVYLWTRPLLYVLSALHAGQNDSVTVSAGLQVGKYQGDGSS